MPQTTEPTAAPDKTIVLGSDTRFRRYVLEGTHIRVLPPADDGRQHSVFVGFPYAQEKNPRRRFPALYLCDGFWDFVLFVGLYGNLVWEKAAPEFYIIGLSYGGNPEHPRNDDYRHCDYLPFPPSDRRDTVVETNWNSDRYLEHLRTTVIPFVESEYGVDPSYRVLAGNSIGGLLALTSMFKAPGLFQGHIALNPPVAFGDNWILKEEEAFYRSRQTAAGRLLLRSPKLRTQLFLSSAELDNPAVQAGVAKFEAQLRKRSYLGLDLQHTCIAGEGHGASKAAGFSRGIRWAFRGYQEPADATQ